ncbi:MAG: hypothetical protein PHX78_08240 [bacterium]|nr:hypothetical protein [bacterium]
MNKKIILFIIISLIINVTALAQENAKSQENIGYKFYTSKSPVYYYISSFESKNGEIFVDWDDNLFVVNVDGTFTYNSSGVLVNHLNERIQIPTKADGSGNIYILQQNKIKKLSPQKDLITSFSLDDDAKLINIDDKGNYYLIYLRKEFKTNEYNDELSKIEDNIKELSQPIEIPDNGETASIAQRFLDYRDEIRDTTWALDAVKFDYDNSWKEFEFGTASLADKSKIKAKADNDLAQINAYNARLAFIAKDIDFWKDRLAQIEKNTRENIKDKQKENSEEMKRLKEDKGRILKQIEEDKKLKYEIRVYTSDKYLTSTIPIPLVQEGIPLYLCQIIVSDKSGNYYGTDGKTVYVYDWEGVLLSSFDGDHNGGLKAISQLAVDSRGNIYVMDSLKNRISKFGLGKPVLDSLK